VRYGLNAIIISSLIDVSNLSVMAARAST